MIRKFLSYLFDHTNANNRYRRPMRSLNQDARQLVPTGTHQQLVSAGRWLFSNFAPVRGALLEQATYSVQPFVPQYIGRDKEWGAQAEEWLANWHKVLDVQGQCDFEELLHLALISIKRDGDVGILLTQGQAGYPSVQMIPAHRIGSKTSGVIESGAFKGRSIHNGVITNRAGRAVGYELTTGRRVAARDLALCYFPEWSDQGRGLTTLATVVSDLQDVAELRGYELSAQKAASSISLVEHNENGYADESEAFIEQDTTGNKLDSTVETLEGGAIRYFRAGSNAKLEVLESNRPSKNGQDFEATILRAAFQAIEWPYDFSLDPSKIGGAVVRLVAAKAQRTIEKNQRLVKKIARRIDGYALAKAIKLGLIDPPPTGDWYSWNYQGPRRLTVDAGRDAGAAREDYKLGLTTLQELYAERGLNWEEELQKRVAEQRVLIDAANSAGIDPNRVQLLTPNGLSTNNEA